MLARMGIGNVVPAQNPQTDDVDVGAGSGANGILSRLELREDVGVCAATFHERQCVRRLKKRFPKLHELVHRSGGDGREPTHRLQQVAGAQPGPLHRVNQKVADWK